MYTRCPSCRCEICFEPPANAASLPDGYKHKIKCPNCGAKISVAIPNTKAEVVQPTYTPNNPYAAQPETVFSTTTIPVTEKEAKKEAKKAKKEKAEKKPAGRGKSAFMLILSLLMVAVAVLGYLVKAGTLKVEIMNGLVPFDGISPLMNATKLFEGGVPLGIIALLPSIFAVLAALTFIVSIIALAAGKYPKAFFLIFGLLIAGAAVCTLFAPVFVGMVLGVKVEIGAMFKSIIDSGLYLEFVGAGLGVLTFIFSLFFLAGGKKAK